MKNISVLSLEELRASVGGENPVGVEEMARIIGLTKPSVYNAQDSGWIFEKQEDGYIQAYSPKWRFKIPNVR